MKKILVCALLICIATRICAQFDARFYYPDKEIVHPEGLTYTEYFFTADADTLSAVFIPSEGKPKAAVLFFHGNSLNLWQAIYNVRPLVSNGYSVMMWDYRGFGKSTGTPTHLNIAEDARIVFDSFSEMEDIKNLPVIFYGSSIGAQAAVHTASAYPGRVKGIVLDGTAKSFTDLAIITSPAEYRNLIEKFVSSPYSVEEDIRKLNGVGLLFIHSEEDFIPYRGAEDLYESCELPKKFWKYNGPHIRAAIVDPDGLVENIDWLLRHD